MLTANQKQELRKMAEIAAPVFVAQGWTWGYPGFIPSAIDINNTLTTLIEARSWGDFVSTGRLAVSRSEEWGEIDFFLHLGEMDDPAITTAYKAARKSIKRGVLAL